jgi:hypothetical protein
VRDGVEDGEPEVAHDSATIGQALEADHGRADDGAAA